MGMDGLNIRSWVIEDILSIFLLNFLNLECFLRLGKLQSKSCNFVFFHVISFSGHVISYFSM